MIAVWVCMCSVAVRRALLHTTEHALTRSRAPLSDHEVSGTGEHGLGPVSTKPASHREIHQRINGAALDAEYGQHAAQLNWIICQ